jgi:hypothetical protein
MHKIPKATTAPRICATLLEPSSKSYNGHATGRWRFGPLQNSTSVMIKEENNVRDGAALILIPEPL